MQKQPIVTKKNLHLSLLFVLFLLLLAACGGADEAIEEAGEADTTETDTATDAETIDDGDVSATGSEEDSGELPPTPQPVGKVETVRATPNPAGSELIAANPTAPANRIETESTAVPLDVALLIDGTGSMANELANLQASLPSLAADLATLSESTDLRLGLVAYRDQEKLAAVQIFDFTEDTAAFVETVGNLTAAGGGDYPEAVADGFNQAVSGLNWQAEANKLLIILGDAPPQPNSNFVNSSQQAATQNITIFTIGSDGLDATGAAVFAQVAQNGNGRFLFITDNPETSPGETTAVYPTSQLGSALIEIIREVLDAQAP